MTEDEMQRKMEFIVNQQAQFAADIGRLEGSVVQLTGIVGQLASGLSDLTSVVSTLADAQVRTEKNVAVIAEKMIELAESQAHTDRRLDALIDIIREERNGKSQG